MWTEFRYTVGRLRGQILGWGMALAVLGLIIVPFYSSFQAQQEQFMELMASYPPEMLAFFGSDPAAITTPQGYLQYYFFSLLPILVGLFAVLAASGLLASDEEAGRLDLVLAHPVSRTRLFWGRTAAFAAAALAVTLLGWLGCVLPLGASTLEVSVWQLALGFVPLLAQILIYGALALLLSQVLPSRGLAATTAGLVLVVSYLASSLGSLNEGLAALARFLPYEYYQGGEALNGLNWAWLGGLLGASALLALLAWWRFARRDVRLAGEGGWRLPWPLRWRRTVEV
jgi:ABC-2 type transport system permease protein